MHTVLQELIHCRSCPNRGTINDIYVEIKWLRTCALFVLTLLGSVPGKLSAKVVLSAGRSLNVCTPMA